MLNESKGNMYSWVTHTWNTVKGECPHGCTYCYMKRWGKQKPVWFDEKELKTDLGSGNIIFVGSSCDLFANDIPFSWIRDTVKHCNEFNNTYLFQSKNPLRFHGIWPYYPSKLKFCTTIETNRFYKSIMVNSPDPVERAMQISDLKFWERYITIEPIMDFDLYSFSELIKRCEPTQVNIGADSGNNHLPEPSKDKLLALIDELKKFTTIDQKRNLQRLLK